MPSTGGGEARQSDSLRRTSPSVSRDYALCTIDKMRVHNRHSHRELAQYSNAAKVILRRPLRRSIDFNLPQHHGPGVPADDGQIAWPTQCKRAFWKSADDPAWLSKV